MEKERDSPPFSILLPSVLTLPSYPSSLTRPRGRRGWCFTPAKVTSSPVSRMFLKGSLKLFSSVKRCLWNAGTLLSLVVVWELLAPEYGLLATLLDNFTVIFLRTLFYTVATLIHVTSKSRYKAAKKERSWSHNKGLQSSYAEWFAYSYW